MRKREREEKRRGSVRAGWLVINQQSTTSVDVCNSRVKSTASRKMEKMGKADSWSYIVTHRFSNENEMAEPTTRCRFGVKHFYSNQQDGWSNKQKFPTEQEKHRCRKRSQKEEEGAARVEINPTGRKKPGWDKHMRVKNTCKRDTTVQYSTSHWNDAKQASWFFCLAFLI